MGHNFSTLPMICTATVGVDLYDERLLITEVSVMILYRGRCWHPFSTRSLRRKRMPDRDDG